MFQCFLWNGRSHFILIFFLFFLFGAFWRVTKLAPTFNRLGFYEWRRDAVTWPAPADCVQLLINFQKFCLLFVRYLWHRFDRVEHFKSFSSLNLAPNVNQFKSNGKLMQWRQIQFNLILIALDETTVIKRRRRRGEEEFYERRRVDQSLWVVQKVKKRTVAAAKCILWPRRRRRRRRRKGRRGRRRRRFDSFTSFSVH